MKNKNRKYDFIYFLFTLPALVFFTTFFIIPFIRSLWTSLTDAYGYNPESHFIGLKNYIEAFSKEDFIHSIWITLKYTLLMTVATNILALFFALLLDGKCHFKKFFRSVFFLPNLMSLIIVGFVWVFLYGSVYQSFIRFFSIPKSMYISWLGGQHTALFSIAITAVWQCAGYYMLIYIAALQNISVDLIEAAQIDGATSWIIIHSIKLPLLLPTIIVNTILLVTAGFKTFDVPMSMTSGGPAGATTTLALQIYNTGFRSNRIGYASAQSVILFIIISLITIVLYWFQTRKEN